MLRRKDKSGAGLRKHRPEKRFRFEYIKGKLSGLTAEERKWRAFAEREKEEDGYQELMERLKQLQNKR